MSVFIKPWLINKGVVKRIYKAFEETVVLFVDKKFVKLNRDLVIFFAYIAPEQSPIYDPENNNGIELLHEKICLIESELGDVMFLIGGDLNARVKDFLDYIEEDDLNYIYIMKMSRTPEMAFV